MLSGKTCLSCQQHDIMIRKYEEPLEYDQEKEKTIPVGNTINTIY